MAATIAAVAEAHDASVVIVGSRGRSGVRSTPLGSVTYGLLHATRRPILIARRRAIRQLERLGHKVTRSNHSWRRPDPTSTFIF